MYIIRQYLPLFQKYLESNEFIAPPAQLYAPVNYIMRLGGKRLRPILTLATCGLYKTDIEEALPAALAIEVFHNFSLVHDDIMDDAPLRRGKATVHELYDTNRAILSGDVMLILSYQLLCKTSDKSKIPLLLEVFNNTAIKVCEGQQYDMNFEAEKSVAIADYLIMIEMKTAALLQGALEIGAIIGGASAVDVKHLSEFGRNIGIAFQLQDDLLDTFGDAKKFGKQTGGDIIQNKKTFLVLKALEIASTAHKAELLKWMNSGHDDDKKKVTEVTKLFKKLEIPKLTFELIVAYKTKALEHLAMLSIEEKDRKGLVEFAEMIIEREV